MAQGLSQEKSSVLYNGVDCELFCPRPCTGHLHRELQVSEASFVLLTVGQIGLRKGQDVLAAAAKEIASSIPRVQVVIVGRRDSAKEESVRFEQDLLASFGGMRDQLHCLGYRDDVWNLMNEADVLVHPAKQEPLGRVLLESAAAGLPIVTTAVGGTEEILCDGQSARLVTPNDPIELASAVIELAQSPQLRNKLAESARATVMTRFRPEVATDGLLAIWRSLLKP